jgi:hypothetical protein
MFRRLLPSLIVLPVLLAAWLTFSATPVSGLPLNQVVMVNLDAEADEASEVLSETTDSE